MRALDSLNVDEPSSAADQRAAGKGQPGHALPAALVDRPRAIGNALAALDHPADRRMGLPALEFLERADPGVRIIERGHEPQGHLTIGLVVEEPAAPDIAFTERPALRVDHLSRFMLVGSNVPQLLYSKSVNL